MTPATVDILMYHAIEDVPGPTSIAPDAFEMQIQALADSGLPVLRMDDVADHLSQGSGRAVAITFDDGFQDFADCAHPVLKRHGFAAMVYLPTDHIGGSENWQGCNDPARPLMTWDTIRDLTRDGVDFGNHTASHPDLDHLTSDEIAVEIDRASDRMAEELGNRPRHFAPPYGSGMPGLLPIARSRFSTSVTTALDSATKASDPVALPRLEMFYYTDPTHWRRQLAGRGRMYLTVRRAARKIRRLLPG